MLRLVRVRETTVTDVLIDVQEGDDAEAMVQAYHGLHGLEAEFPYYESEYEDITDKVNARAMAMHDIRLAADDYDRDELLKEIG